MAIQPAIQEARNVAIQDIIICYHIMIALVPTTFFSRDGGICMGERMYVCMVVHISVGEPHIC